MLKGSLVAIVTPMHEDGSLDLPAIARSDRLSYPRRHRRHRGRRHHRRIADRGFRRTLPADPHRGGSRSRAHPVIAGTGANSTREAIELSAYAKQAGADMSLSVVPYYNKPTQEGLVPAFPRHRRSGGHCRRFCTTCRAARSPTCKTTRSLRLAQIPNIVGLKDATGNMERGADLLRRAPKDFAVYSGDDGTGLALHAAGGSWRDFGDRQRRAAADARNVRRGFCRRRWPRRRSHNNKLLGLHRHLFVEANPIPVKWVLQQMGLMGGGIRLAADAAVVVLSRSAARCDGTSRHRTSCRAGTSPRPMNLVPLLLSQAQANLLSHS